MHPRRGRHTSISSCCKKIIIRIADTDVVLLAISVVEEIKVEELWDAFETGKHFRYTAAHAIGSSLGADKSRTLPVFHAVTDCDTVSFFGWTGKTEGLTHMNCIPYSGVGFFRSWYWDSESVTRCIWEDWAICCVHVWKEQYSDNSECSKAKAVLPKMQSHQHIYLHRAPRLPSPSAWGWTKDNHGSHYGQQWMQQDRQIETEPTSRSNSYTDR